MPSLRSKLIKLARSNPELRPHLLPILKKSSDAEDDLVHSVRMLSLSSSGILEYVDAYGSGFRKGLDGLVGLADIDEDNLQDVRKLLIQANSDLDKVLEIFKRNVDQTGGRVPTAYNASLVSMRRQINVFMEKFAGSLADLISSESRFKRLYQSFSGATFQYLQDVRGTMDPKILKEIEQVEDAREKLRSAFEDLSYAVGNYVTRNTRR